MACALRWRGVTVVAVVLGVAVGTAWAEPYWFAYEGNEFPENEGWVRYATNPPAQRWLENGSLFIDSRADPGITDSYGMCPAGGLDPQPGETFVMAWRMNVQEAAPWEDPGVGVTSDERYAVIFIFAEDYLLSFYEPGVYVQLEPNVFHEFELRSGDMRSYELHVDGNLALEGVFFEGYSSPVAGFGDIVRGGSSLAAWDYFRFGVVPEPSARVMALVALLCTRTRRI